MSSSSIKVYEWEKPKVQERAWENPEGGLAAWNEDDQSSGDEAVVPEEELASYMLEQHRMGALNAKQVCVISHWASLARVSALKSMALPPDAKGTGDFKRLLDQVGKTNTRELYVVDVPAYIRAAGGRSNFGLHCLLPHELLMQDVEGLNLQELQNNWEEAPNYKTHPVVVAASEMPDALPVMPLALFLDGVAYTKRDSLLAITIHNLWTGNRFVVAVVRKKLLCRCSWVCVAAQV